MPSATFRPRALAARVALAVALSVALVGALPVEQVAVAANCARAADFDRDGIDDLAVGVPGEGVGSAAGAGAVSIIFGARDGVFARDLLVTQESPSVDGTAEVGDRFGAAVATGDFNNDGFADVAIGAPGENAGAGAVTVVYGSAEGPSATLTRADQLVTQNSGAIPGAPEAGDGFGAALTVGDIDGNLYDDLLVGAPGEDHAGAQDAGVVVMIAGSASGLNTSAVAEMKQGMAGLTGSPEDGDAFGRALASCDFNGGGRDDIAIGIAEGIGSAAGAGAVQVVLGSVSGPTTSGAQWLQQGDAREGTPEAGDDFGAALAVGDVDGDGLADLAVGAPGEGVGPDAQQGLVQVFTGVGGTLATDVAWHQDSLGVPSAGDPDERFGAAIAVGDFDHDGYADLAIGAPPLLGGSVTALYGTATGPSASRAAAFTQDTGGVPGGRESGDRWGSALAARDVDGDGIADLAIGAWSENGSATNDGGLNVLFGARGPSTGGPGLLMGQDAPGIDGAAEDDDNFGFAIG